MALLARFVLEPLDRAPPESEHILVLYVLLTTAPEVAGRFLWLDPIVSPISGQPTHRRLAVFLQAASPTSVGLIQDALEEEVAVASDHVTTSCGLM
uniref:Uncharacterized protein n=1 Tax=Coconut foliar decay virus TaxID=12474 RepID=A0A2R4N9D7_9VIRU|nr:hypothetical protein [Coconut foliar decay virus]AVX29456.1 hypothetical protein [Coconut foliar decay virus]AVX29459.1 hypothetical protein [Coconut foliar decay virus]